MSGSKNLIAIHGIAWLCFLFITTGCHLQGNNWSRITECRVTHRFGDNREADCLKTIITDRHGRPLYCLDARLCWRDFDDEKNYYYSGALDCRLYPVDEPTYPTLLFNVPHPDRDWQTYGRFTHRELSALIGSDGSRRLIQDCCVRGMFIEIAVFNVVASHTEPGEGDNAPIVGCEAEFVFSNGAGAKGKNAGRERVGQ
jgi:hypothetical protein